MKKLLILGIILSLYSCNIIPESLKKNENAVSSTTNKTDSIPTPSGYYSPSISSSSITIPTPDPYKSYRNLEIYTTTQGKEFTNLNTGEFVYREYSTFCEPLNISTKQEIKYPVDLAVSKNGDVVYVINGRCDLNSPSFIEECYIGNNPKIVIKRNFIYKVSKDKKVEIVKVNNIPPINCHMAEEIEIDNENNIYISDKINHRLYKILNKENKLIQLIEINEKSQHPISLASGLSPEQMKPKLDGPHEFFIDTDNNFYFIMSSPDPNGEFIIKKLERNNEISDFYKSSRGGDEPHIYCIYKEQLYIGSEEFKPPYYSKDESQGLLSEWKFKLKIEIADMVINSKGEIYIVDNISNHCVWKIIPHKSITKFVGNGKPGFKDGIGEEAQFNFPSAISIDKYDNLYIADTGNSAIRKITPNAIVTTFYRN